MYICKKKCRKFIFYLILDDDVLQFTSHPLDVQKNGAIDTPFFFYVLPMNRITF